MTSTLPHPIEQYLAAENSGVFASLDRIFAPTARVHDERREHVGLPAIREWMVETRKKYAHRMTPLRVTQRGDDTVVEIGLSGNFPGSPITLDFVFGIADGKIVSLDIHP